MFYLLAICSKFNRSTHLRSPLGTKGEGLPTYKNMGESVEIQEQKHTKTFRATRVDACLRNRKTETVIFANRFILKQIKNKSLFREC